MPKEENINPQSHHADTITLGAESLVRFGLFCLFIKLMISSISCSLLGVLLMNTQTHPARSGALPMGRGDYSHWVGAAP